MKYKCSKLGTVYTVKRANQINAVHIHTLGTPKNIVKYINVVKFLLKSSVKISSQKNHENLHLYFMTIIGCKFWRSCKVCYKLHLVNGCVISLTKPLIND